MRRLFSILILALLSVNLVGGYFYFFVRTVQIKKDMRAMLQALPDNQLDFLTLTVEEFNTARVDAHEIKVNGKMYDIARVQLEGDVVQVFCLHDKAEDNLLGFLGTVLNRIQNDTTRPPASIIQFTLLQYIPVQFEFTIFLPDVILVATTPYHSGYFSLERFVESPPPQA